MNLEGKDEKDEGQFGPLEFFYFFNNMPAT